jgi:hypothetical protein
MNSAGDFVVAWESDVQDGDKTGIYAQRFNPAGVPQGLEFRVNSYTTETQAYPAVAIDASGDFMVAWQSWLQDGSSDGVYAQRYDESGLKVGGEFRINTTTDRQQRHPSVAMDAAGDVVVAWYSYKQDGAGYGIYAQRYNEAGVPQGGEFRVNTYTLGHQGTPAAAMDPFGNFVVAWQSSNQDGNGYGVYAQRFNAAGAPQGGEFRANTFTTNDQHSAAVAMDADGDFVIAWQSKEQDGSYWGAYAQRFNAAGLPLGGELQVNTFTSSRQRYASVGMSANDEFVVVWESTFQDAQYEGVYAQRYGLHPTPTVATLSDNPDPVTTGNSITLVAGGVNSEDSTISSVGFYRESNGEPGLQVGVEGDTLVGAATSDVDGFWSLTLSTAGLGEGKYTYYAQASDGDGFAGAPASTTNTIIPSVPIITNAQFHFDTLPQKLLFTFSEDVSASLTLADIVVRKLSGGPIITPSGLSYNSATNVATVTFNGVLADGRYRATLSGAGIISAVGIPMGTDYNFDFKFLQGDADNDGDVDVNDLGILATNWQRTQRTFSQGDFDYSGTVNVGDLGILATNWQQNLAPPSAPFAVTPPYRIPSTRIAVDVL